MIPYKKDIEILKFIYQVQRTERNSDRVLYKKLTGQFDNYEFSLNMVKEVLQLLVLL